MQSFVASRRRLREGTRPGTRRGSPPASPAVWLITLAGLALAWGLWQHRVWAWYAALACSVYAIVRMAWYTYPMLADASYLLVSTPVGMRLALLVSLLCVLLFSNARKLCAGHA